MEYINIESLDLFGEKICQPKHGEIIKTTYEDAVKFILPIHYSGRVPSISLSYGWIVNGKLVACITFGKPASNQLCIGICGKEYSDRVYELNRLCRIEGLEYQLSEFVSAVLRTISQYNIIVVSYSDSAMSHHGYIYQACNFIYTGETKQRTDMYTEGNKHSRHYSQELQRVGAKKG